MIVNTAYNKKSNNSTSQAIQSKDVNFINYDGTLLYSYTLAEAKVLTELPALPSHDGLICQGWNWSLADIKALGRAVTVGAMYITDDGKTRIYIHLEEGRTSPMLGCCPNGTVTVDWGDGTAPDTLTGTSTGTVKWTPTHNYAAPGDYVIKLTVNGSMGLYGTNSTKQYSGLLRHSASSDARNYVYQNAIQKVEIGDNVTSIGSYAFGSCNSLSSITIPDGVTSIGSYAFGSCYSLSSITIPDGVTSIGSYAFDGCSGVKFYDFTAATAVPTLANANAFTGIADDCEIRVPIALYEEWMAATNWSTYADHIVYVGTPYYLNVASNDGGTVTPTGQVIAPPGCTRTLKIVPDGTHELSDITLDGTSVKSATTYADASSNAWAVEAVDNASYGFALNANGYYESQNKGKSSSAAVCKIAITVLAEIAMSLDIINSGESNYDYGLLGAVDQVLITTNSADSGVVWSGKGKSSTDVVNVPFTIPAGTHYIYAKFIKDGSGQDGNDSLQFKVNLPTESFWSYKIENVQSDHNIVVTFNTK